MGFNDCIAKCMESILGLQDKIGATIHEVFIVERIWDGKQIGDGNSKDRSTKIEPSPHVQMFGHDLRAGQGAIEQGDILLKMISKRYSKEFLGAQTDSPNIEKFYLIDGKEYRVSSVQEHLAYFNVLIKATVTQRKR